jgi:hypothetical protein
MQFAISPNLDVPDITEEDEIRQMEQIVNGLNKQFINRFNTEKEKMNSEKHKMVEQLSDSLTGLEKIHIMIKNEGGIRLCNLSGNIIGKEISAEAKTMIFVFHSMLFGNIEMSIKIPIEE